jgi:hypothetical protein
MSWDETLALSVYFIPQLKTMLVANRRRRLLKLSQQQQVGLVMSDTAKFITV